MARLEVSPAMRAICEAVAGRHLVELVDVRFGRSGRSLILEVVIDRDSEVDFDLVTAVSADLSDALDEVDDDIEGSYVLEVSSAGLERPLYEPAHYARFSGRQIRVVCREPVSGATEMRGPILEASEDAVTLDDVKRGSVTVPYASIKKAHLWVDWEQEFKKAEEHTGGDETSSRRRKRKFVGGKR